MSKILASSPERRPRLSSVVAPLPYHNETTFGAGLFGGAGEYERRALARGVLAVTRSATTNTEHASNRLTKIVRGTNA